MNLKGLKILKERGITIMKDTLFFRNLKDVPKSLIDDYANKKTMSVRGFDDRVKISDSPYNIISPWKACFSSEELKEKFLEVDKVLQDKGVPQEHREFFVCEGWSNDEVEFSGHAHLHDNVIHVDIMHGNRPHLRDWTPNFSLTIKVINGRPLFSGLQMGSYSDYVIDICKNIVSLYDNSYIDFTKLKSGRFVYHDLSIH